MEHLTKPSSQATPGEHGIALGDDFSDELPKLGIKHPDSTPAELEHASSSVNREVREAVAAHPNTPVHVLETLSVDPEWKVRLAVTRNANTTREVLSEMSSHDSSPVVRKAARETLRKIAN